MSRIYSAPGIKAVPSIDRDAVASFFEARAAKVSTLGAVRAVIYQDKDLNLAQSRDAAEKKLILPKLALRSSHRILDVGCGTGRWTRELLASGATYHGIDASDGLLAIARQQYAECPRCRFSLASIDRFTLSSIHETSPFDRVLCAGVLIYLNDDELHDALRNLMSAIATGGRIVLREPVGIDRRLTIQQHFSADMDQIYNAIYRTESELRDAIRITMGGARIIAQGDVYSDGALNNRADTRQRWLVLERDV